jgi:hypothetical protein
MMARPRTPDGRRVPVSFKLTDAEAELVDSLRGETERSVWLRDIAIAAARKMRDNGIRKRPARGTPPKAPKAPERGTGKVESASDIAAFFSRRNGEH